VRVSPSPQPGWLERLERQPGWVALAVLVLQLAVHLPRAGTPALWGDEAVNLWWAELPFAEMVRTVLDSDNPPLFFVLLHGWIRVFGIGAFAVRALPSLLAAAATALTWLAARRTLPVRVAWLALPVLLVSPALHEYAHELRPSTLACALAAASIALLPWLPRRRAWIAVAAYALLDVALVCSHYLALLFFPVQLAIAALTMERATLRRLLCAQALAVTMLVPIAWWVVVVNHVRPHIWLTRPGLTEVREVLAALSGNLAALSALAVLAVLGLVRAFRRRPLDEGMTWRAVLAAACWGLGPPLADALLSQIQPMFQVRYVLYATPGLVLLTVSLVEVLPLPPPGRVAVVLVLALVAATGFRLAPAKPHDWDTALARVQELRGPDGWLVLHPRWHYRVLSYYLDRDGFRNPHGALAHLSAQRVMTLARDDLPDVAALAAARTVVLVSVDADGFDPKRQRAAALAAAGLTPRDVVQVGKIELRTFVRP
jgi:mannosyltransferase